MTSNQIAYKQAVEAEKANKERERSNRANEKETARHNKRSENINLVGHIAKGIGGIGKGVGSIIGSAINDPAWYNKDPQLVKDAASISFHNPLGNTFTNEVGDVTVPGIVTLQFIPSIGANGHSLHNNNANITAKNVYAYVRYANSGSRNYDAPDLMMYLLAMDQVYSYWAYLRRIYSVALTFKGSNRYYNNAMLQALGVDPDNIRANLANLRSFINTIAMRANSFYVPNTMTYYNRHVWLNSSIFKDQPVKKSQEYVFIQECYLMYDDINGKLTTCINRGGVVDTAPVFKAGGAFTFAQLQAIGNGLLNYLADSEDIGIMSGDILKAYGQDKLFFLPTTEEDYHIESVYSPEVLAQIQAATLVQLVDDTNAILAGYFDINQDSAGSIYQGVACYTNPTDITPWGYGIPCYLGKASRSGNRTAMQNLTTYPAPTGYHMINLYKDDVTPDDVMVTTRLITNVDPVKRYVTNVSTDTDYNKAALIINGCGSEIVNSASTITITNNGSVYAPSIVYGTYNQPSSMSIAINSMCELSRFDWFPLTLWYHSTSSVNAEDYLADTANYTSISADNINNMHYVACLSEFGVPLLGTTVRTR